MNIADIGIMESMTQLGRALAIAGLLIFITGLFLWLGGRLPSFGKIPGDFSFKSKNFGFYFPFGSSILISLVLSLILYVIRKFF